MLTEANAAIGGIKAALDVLRGVQAFKSETERNQAIIDIQRLLLEAQSAALSDYEKRVALLSRIRELEALLADADKWGAERDRYQLTEFPTGVFAYVLKDGHLNGDPSHRICAKCFEEGVKSILQTRNKHSGGESVTCKRCNDNLTLHAFPTAKAVSVGRRRDTWLNY